MKIKALFISLLACALGAYSQQSMPAAGEGQIVGLTISGVSWLPAPIP
jgi:hypothetical protein